MTATPLNKFKMTGTRIDSLVGYGLTEIIIPTEVTEIKEYAFQDTSHNSRIQRIIIPDSVTRIGAFSMRDCKSLEEVYLPSSVTRLEKYTFFHCPQLSNIVLPENLTYIGEYALCSCGLVNVVIPKAVTTIATAAFMSCERLLSVSIPGSVTNFGDSVFYKCNNLTIYTTQGSAAEAYAKKHNIPYKIVDEVIVSTPPVPTLKPHPLSKTSNSIPFEDKDDPSFADELSKATKTKQQVKEENKRLEEKRKQDFNNAVESFVQKEAEYIIHCVENDCKKCASAGIRTLMHDYTLAQSRIFIEKPSIKRTAYNKVRDLVLKDLQGKGFRTVHVKLRLPALHIYVRW